MSIQYVRFYFQKLFKKISHTKPVFEVGDTVRIARKKYTFQKGYEKTFSYEVFQIAEIKNTYPVTYGIKDFKNEAIKGSFYKKELEAVDKSDDIWPINKIIKSCKYRGETQFLVKFLGYPETLTLWIA